MTEFHYVVSDDLIKSLCDIYFLFGKVCEVPIEASCDSFVVNDNDNIAFGRVLELACKCDVTEGDVMSIAGVFYENGSSFGEYRSEPDIIYDESKINVLYMPPLPDELPVLMNKYIERLNHGKASLFKAGVCYCQLMTYWPFGDFTFIVGVCMALVVLAKIGFNDVMLNAVFKRLLANKKQLLSCFFGLGSENYYDGRCDVDISQFLMLFCNIIHDAFANDIKQVVRCELPVVSAEKQMLMNELPEEQRLIIDRFRKKRTVKSSDIENILNVSNRQARALCSRWMASGFLAIQDSSKRARRYAIGKAFVKYL